MSEGNLECLRNDFDVVSNVDVMVRREDEVLFFWFYVVDD